jgi:apolipoprotein N-acyltransferase
VASGTTPYSRWLNVPVFAVLGICAMVVVAMRSVAVHFRNRFD